MGGYTPFGLAPGAPPTGLYPLVPGTKLTASTLTAAPGLGVQGFWLDPRVIWDATGLVINGQTPVWIESRMAGGLGFNGNIYYNTTGYIKTDSSVTADGVQIYASAPTTSPTVGLFFKGLIFVGNNSNGTVHLGGGARDITFEDCGFNNLSAAAGSYGLINDTQLANQNSECNHFFNCWAAGGYGGYGLGLNNQSQKANDTDYYSFRTSGGTYGINAAQGGGHNFYGYYDRSNEGTAAVNNTGAHLHFWGGEDDIVSGAGLSHLVAGGMTVLHSRNTSQGAAATTISVTSGTFMATGDCTLRGTISVTGGTADLSDSRLSLGALTISGTAAVLLAASYPNGGPSAFTAWTGTATYNSPAVQTQTAVAGFALQNATPTLLTWTAPNDGAMHLVTVYGSVRVSVAQTGGAIGITATDPGGNALTPALDTGGHATGQFSFTARTLLVQAGSTVTVAQTSAMTAGTALAWAAIVAA
jgi:hypothetical protein